MIIVSYKFYTELLAMDNMNGVCLHCIRIHDLLELRNGNNQFCIQCHRNIMSKTTINRMIKDGDITYLCKTGIMHWSFTL